MRAEHLHNGALLDLDPDGGPIRFAGQRALLIDAVALGLLRKYLVENFGVIASRAVLTQFGYAHGWRMAEAMRLEFKWEDEGELLLAGARVLTLEGLFRVESTTSNPLERPGIMVVDSYEAEQHLVNVGPTETPVCWTICGWLSGYLSQITGRDICVFESKCSGCGDAGCHFMAATREEWGAARAHELSFFDKGTLADSLDVSLKFVVDSLKHTEDALKTRRRALSRVVGKSVAELDPLGIVARSLPMQVVVDLARRVAKVDATVLITGESGVGKERVARLVHEESSRALGPFVAINCGAVTESLLESELFGHARGSFTGATSDRPGLLEAAHRGTILLDEVGEVSPGMQVKLLRAIQEREIRRVGENKTRKIDVRIIAATNRDLNHSVSGGTFRQDLYYRLKVVELHVPALRQRADDILPLARTLLAEANQRMARMVKTLSPVVADQLVRYEWPGNVRELENAMERAVALARGHRVELEDLPEEIRGAWPRKPTSLTEVQSLEDVERAHILAALEHNGGNQTLTAKQLQIGSATLYRKLKRYGTLTGPEPREGG